MFDIYINCFSDNKNMIIAIILFYMDAGLQWKDGIQLTSNIRMKHIQTSYIIHVFNRASDGHFYH